MPLAKNIFDFFLPRFCIHCSDKLKSSEEILCEFCLSQVYSAPDERIKNEYHKKFAGDKLINDFQSNYIFTKEGPFQSLIHELKYNKKFRLGVFLGKIIAHAKHEKIIEWNTDYIIPIPLHQLKKAERGYNQSDYIAAGIGSVLRLPVKKNIIRRTRYTETQTNLNAVERKNNIEGAFNLKNVKKIADKNILLVDDVITTGATISECANVLKANGASKIFALSAAIAE